MPWAQPSAVRTTTSDLYPALDRGARVVTLQQVFDAAPGEPMPLDLALQLGAAVAERVSVVHTAGRTVGAFDAARVRLSVDGRVYLAREATAPLAPELVVGEPATAASDVYAVAHLIHQMLTGSAPMSTVHVPPSRFNPKLDAEVDAVVLAALREAPEERPASVLALQAALEGLGEELGFKNDPQLLGRLAAKVLDAPGLGTDVPRTTKTIPVMSEWLKNPPSRSTIDGDEEDEMESDAAEPPSKRPVMLLAVGVAAVMAMVSTLIAVNLGSTSGPPPPTPIVPRTVPPPPEPPPVITAVAEPAAEKVEAPAPATTTVAAAPAAQQTPAAATTPATAPAQKKKHRKHR
jgi:hypothetical protein